MPTGVPGSKSIPTCHPRLPYQAKGLCKRCYQRKYRPLNLKHRDRSGERFGITPQEYHKLRRRKRKEGNLCGLCKKPLGKKANLDHKHGTLPIRLRDFLHPKCNLAIGLLGDSSKMCRLAAEYLERHGD